MFRDIYRHKVIGYDTETTGLNFGKDRAFGFSVATPDGWKAYFDLRQTPKAAKWITDQLHRHGGPLVVGHNIQFDYIMSHNAGIALPIRHLDDTMTRACLINEHRMSYDLDSLAKDLLKRKKQSTIYEELARLFGGAPTRKAQIHRLHQAPPEIVAPYAEDDAELALLLWQYQEKQIASQNRVDPPLDEILAMERQLAPTIIRAQMAGVRVDIDAAEQAQEKITTSLEQHQQQLNDIVGWNINTNSPPQVKKALKPYQDDTGAWFAGDGTLLETTPGGGPKMDAPALRRMKDPAAKLIQVVRSEIKTRDTFLGKHVLGHQVDGRVYPSIHQNKGYDGGTGTGRMSYTDPALQQIPSRDKSIAKVVKSVFLPDPDDIWVDCDMASFEVRVFASLIGTKQIIDAYRNNPNLDLHQFVADLTGLPRNSSYPGQAYAKQLNLSAIFNSGNGSIADAMGMPWRWDSFTTRNGEHVRYRRAGPEAMRVIDQYHRTIPGIKELAANCRTEAEVKGFIHTELGRRIRFPRGFKSYKASGLKIQATAADLNKENWMIIEEVLNCHGGRLVLNTHDSYSMSIPPDRVNQAYADVKQEIERPGRLKVPLVLELSGQGDTWWDAIKRED